VTGVQTCALPILRWVYSGERSWVHTGLSATTMTVGLSSLQPGAPRTAKTTARATLMVDHRRPKTERLINAVRCLFCITLCYHMCHDMIPYFWLNRHIFHFWRVKGDSCVDQLPRSGRPVPTGINNQLYFP